MKKYSIPQHLFSAACDSVVMPPSPSYYEEFRNTLFSKEFAPRMGMHQEDYMHMMAGHQGLAVQLETALQGENPEVALAKIGQENKFKMPFFISVNLVE